jgi:hypothetical protein
MPVFALYEFGDTTLVVDDSADNGLQNGTFLNGATASDGKLVLDGVNDFAKIYPSAEFQMDRGTLEITFTPTDATMDGRQTVLSRDSVGENLGSYRIEVFPDGSVQVTHEMAGGATTFSTGPDFYQPGDAISLSYAWDHGGAGGALVIQNQTSGAEFSADVPAELTMDMGDQSQPWIIGAGQSTSEPDQLNNIDGHFTGTVEVFSLSDTVDNSAPPVADGIVRGTAGGEVIDTSYVDPFDGDRIDATDALISGDGPNDDRIEAGAGNDILIGGQGADSATGGDDRDVFLVTNGTDGFGDFIDGSEGGDDFDTLDLSGAGPLSIDYDPTNPENGVVTFRDAYGNPTGTLNFVNVEIVTPCFTPGTLIATPRGEVPVESLRPGDKVVTRDNGIQEIRWVGERAMSGQDLRLHSHLQPIFVKRGALGNGLPEQDMMVSPNHRLLVANDRTQLYFDEQEVLVAAKHLIGTQGVHSVESIGVTYIHFMFDRHEVVLSNGAWTESFQPGDLTLKGMGNAQRSEIYDLFPELKTDKGMEDYTAARRTLRRHEARLLVK